MSKIRLRLFRQFVRCGGTRTTQKLECCRPDDVEADLDTILKDRMVATDDEDENEEEGPEERGETADRIQPKRADEELCPACFLLVRQGAPVCPVGDDDCPLFR